MSSLASLLAPYHDRDHQQLVVVTAVIVFLDGLAISYWWYLRRLNHDQLGLSTAHEYAWVFVPLLFVPVLLFLGLYFTARHIERALPLWSLLPGIAATVLIGGLAGQLVGVRLWPAAAPITFIQGSQLLSVHHHPQILFYWGDFLDPLVSAFITAVAALGLAQARD